MWEDDYHSRSGLTDRPSHQAIDNIQIETHDAISENSPKLLYTRSAYRNDPEFRLGSLTRQGDPLKTISFNRMIDNDATVSRNYQRLAAQGFDDLYGSENEDITFKQYRDGSLGDIRNAISELFPDLVLEAITSPLEDGTFRFSKGVSKKFAYKNLSGGEKAAFDLILDIAIARKYFDNTLYCIDEPEAHMHAHLQGKLLSALFQLIPEECQLMIATHSIGMMSMAQEIQLEHPESVVYLNFDGHNFDESVVIEPTTPNKAFWRQAYKIAFGDLADLVAPRQIVICEGEPITSPPKKNHSIDAFCFNKIFEAEFPETEFISMGNDLEVINDRRGLREALTKLLGATKIIRIIDRDDRSADEITRLGDEGIRVLPRRNLESLLFDDEILVILAGANQKAHLAQDLLTKKEEILSSIDSISPDNLKPACGKIYNACKDILELTQCGNNVEAFMQDTLAPLVKPGLTIYEELKDSIFGSQ